MHKLFALGFHALNAWTLAAVCATSAAAGSFDQPMFPAFPGAEGAGAYTRGGRGGKVLLVTTLEDYDPKREKPISGSLRAAVKTRGPRIILFRVGGTIELKNDLDITEPFLTIAGQSAPGGGICLKNASLKIQAPQVVIRHLRVRPGDVQRRELDCISCSAQNVILDHCSASWGIDETISTNGNSADVTVGWCLIVESLNHSVHHKGSHGYGSLVSGPGEITYHHNVYAYHRSRSPRGGDVLLDFRNNLVAAWGDRAGYSGADQLQMNYVGNYLRPADFSKLKTAAFSPGGLRQQIFIEGNYFDGLPEASENNWLLIKPPVGVSSEKTEQALRAQRPFATCSVTTDTAAEAYERIMREAGAILPARDAADRRVLEQIRTGTGKLIDSQADVGGWPTLAPGEAPADTDLDGMPDEWERRCGFDPLLAGDSKRDADGDEYPDLEEFLNGTDPRTADPWIDPPAVASSAGDAYVGETRVTISTATTGAEIHYTLDDSLPTRSSPRYAGPFVLARPALVRAVAFLGDRASHVRNARLQNLSLAQAEEVSDAQAGLQYKYFEELDDKNPAIDVLSALETATPKKTGTSATITLEPRAREDQFGFLYSGFIRVPQDGIYTFTLRCSPRGRLSIAGHEVVESQGMRRERAGKVALARGLHAIRFAIYYGSPVDKTLEISYEGPGISRRSISEALLFYAGQ